MTIERHLLADGGVVPNNPLVPLVVYRGMLPKGRPERIIAHFAARGWSNAWVNGIYDFHHYHATTHEALGLATGSACVQFGGPAGILVNVDAGDGVLSPAGVGHCLLSSSGNLAVAGAYPGGADWDLVRAGRDAADRARPLIAAIAAPATDPIA